MLHHSWHYGTNFKSGRWLVIWRELTAVRELALFPTLSLLTTFKLGLLSGVEPTPPLLFRVDLIRTPKNVKDLETPSSVASASLMT